MLANELTCLYRRKCEKAAQRSQHVQLQFPTATPLPNPSLVSQLAICTSFKESSSTHLPQVASPLSSAKVAGHLTLVPLSFGTQSAIPPRHKGGLSSKQKHPLWSSTSLWKRILRYLRSGSGLKTLGTTTTTKAGGT